MTLMHKNKITSYNCRVCGFNQGFEPWGKDEETPTFDICDYCGVQFGHEDCNIFYVKKFREEWLKNGEKWFFLKGKPKEWILEAQKEDIPEKYR